jgi:CHAT domain-containing protein
MRRLRPLLGLVAVLFTGATALADNAAIETTIRGFYVAYASGDSTAAAKFWTARAAEAFAARADRTLRTRCLVLDSLAIEALTVDNTSATANVDALVTRWSAMPGAQARTEHERATLSLSLDRGAWKIDAWRMREEELADRLLAATTPEEREALLRGSSELQTRRLVEILGRRAVTLLNEDQMKRAAEIVSLMHAIAGELGDPAARALALSAQSVAARNGSTRDPAASLSLARAATALAEEAGDPDLLARLLMRQGRSEPGNDPASFHRTLDLADFVEDASILALAASQLARIADEQRRPREALRYATLALLHAETAGDVPSIISAEMNLGGTYKERKDAELALPHLERALELSDKAAFTSVHSNVLAMLAEAYSSLGNFEAAGRLIAEGLRTLGPDGDWQPRLKLLTMQGAYWRERGRYDLARETFDQAGLLLRNIDPGNVVEYRLLRGDLDLEETRFEEALQEYDQAIEADPKGTTPHYLPYYGRAAALRAMNRVGEARCEFERTIDGVEAYRNSLDYEPQRGLFLQGGRSIYTDYVELLDSMGEHQEALVVSERLKARVLKDLLDKTSQWTTGNEPETRRLNQRVVTLNRKLLAAQGREQQAEPIRAQLLHARAELEDALARSAAPRTPAASAQTLDFNHIHVPDDTILVDYVVAEQRTLVFVLQREGGATRLDTRTIAIDRSTLASLTETLARKIESRNAKYRVEARQLYDLLLRPILGTRSHHAALCVIPDDILWKVPFQALVLPDGSHLVEQRPVSYAPSLLAWSEPAARPARDRPTVLALGDPVVDSEMKSEIRAIYRNAWLGALPDARREVDELGRIYGSRVKVRTGTAARESLLKEEAGRYDIVHLATHGLIDDHAPLYSALLLARSDDDDGLLEAREIPSMPLRADLVILSACDTAGGKIMSGEGMVGLSWGILATGCPRTIATQGRIGSAAAARLMIAFHRRLSKRQSVHDVASILRAAQREMIGDARYSHPYYWAGFILIGRDR